MMQDQYINEFALFDESTYSHQCNIYVNYLKNLITAASAKSKSHLDYAGFNSYYVPLLNRIGTPMKEKENEKEQQATLTSSNEKWSSFSITPSFYYDDPIRVSNVIQKPITKKVTVLIDDSKSIGEEEESTTEGNLYLQKKTNRSTKSCSDCPHKEAKHYAKNMCSNCYHSKGKIKKPWNCPHYTKTHYALGLCQNCYQMNYIKNKQS